jgi:sugar O-acyltransferase (sialic acid O-acetyltransferase NeuD family)
MVIEAAHSQGIYEPTLCLGDSSDPSGSVLGVPAAPETDDLLRSLQSDGLFAIVAIGKNSLRRRLCIKLEGMGYKLATVVASTAWVSPSSHLSPGSVILPHAIVGADCRIGSGCIINTSSSVDHDCQIESYSHIAPGSHLGGNVRVGEEVFLGIGCSVIPETRIGARATLGAGSVVVGDIPASEIWIGCPARFLKQQPIR